MEKDDVQLIRSILSGDDKAFSTLVEKYQTARTCPCMAEDR